MKPMPVYYVFHGNHFIGRFRTLVSLNERQLDNVRVKWAQRRGLTSEHFNCIEIIERSPVYI